MEIVKFSLVTSHRVMSENKIQNDKLGFLVWVVFWMLFPENAHGKFIMVQRSGFCFQDFLID